MRFLRNGATAIFLFVSILAAQGVRATIVGRVTDDSGAVVPGANITITNITRDLSCAYITAGTLNIVPSNRPARLIDFGSGACDDVATVTKNGVTRVIHLHP